MEEEYKNRRFCQKIEEIIFKDPGNRGISKIFQPGCIYNAAKGILSSDKTKKSFVLTGFCCMKETCETDGPLGSAILCRVLRNFNYNTSMLCDPAAEGVCKASTQNEIPLVVKSNYEDLQKDSKDIGFIVSIERPGRSEKDGTYMTCSARDISNVTCPLDLLFPNIREESKKEYLTISVGDGGNEVGTGKVIELIKKNVPKGSDICTISSCDILIMTGVSNWGGIALAAAISILAENEKIGKDFLKINSLQKEILTAMVENGSYDGISGEKCLKIDGMDFIKEHAEVNIAIEKVIREKYNII